MELDFIAAKFVDFELPSERKYLIKYFRSDVEQQFLRYYIMFGNYRRFTDHTGYVCSRRYLRKLRNKLEKLEIIHAEARKNQNISLIVKVESGKMVAREL